MKRLPSLLLAAALAADSVTASTYVWNLVTDDTSLAAGDVIVIAAAEYDYALSTEQKTNNRGATSIEKNGTRLVSPSVLVQQITLQSGNIAGTFALYTGTKYLYAAGGTNNNYLRETNILDDTSSWNITISDGKASIIAADASVTKNKIRFYATTLFSCYSSGQKDVCLYRLEALPALSAPTGLSSSGKTTSGFTVSWTAVSDAAGYTAILLDSTGTTTNATVSCGSSDTTATFSGLSSSTTYLVTVIALGDGTNSSNSPAPTPISVTTATPDDNDPPTLSLSSSVLHIVAGGTADCTVSADKSSVEYSVDGVKKGDGNDIPLDSTDYSFDKMSGHFSFTPATLGCYEFSFTATDTNGTSAAATFTVYADSLSSPQNLQAADIAPSSFTADWDDVIGADFYDVALFAKGDFVFDFESAYAASLDYETISGTVNLDHSAIPWGSTENGARINGMDQQIDGRSLTIKAGTANPVSFGPFPHGIHSISFDYALANAEATAGNIRVLVDSTCIGNSANSPRPLVSMAKPAATVQHFSFTPDTPLDGTLKILCTSADIVIDNVAVESFAQIQPVATPSASTYDFTGLNQATDHFFSVKALGYVDSTTIESDTTVSEIVTTAGNHAPTLSVSGATVPAGTAAILALNGHDDDGDELTYTVSPTGLGTIAIDDQTGAATFTYTPNAVGTTTFTFTVSDGNGGSATADAIVTATLGTPVVTATATDSTFVTLGWGAVTGAAGYRVSGSGTKIGVTGTTVLEETFDKFANIGSSSTRIDDNADTYMDHAGWTVTNAYRGDRNSTNDPGETPTSASLGTGSYAGSLTSPTLDLSGNGGAFVVVFRARRWGGDTGAKVAVVVNGATNETQAVLSDSMATYAIACTGGTSNTVVQITGAKPRDNRFFLDDLKIVSGTATVTDLAVAAELLSVSGTTCTATGLSPDATYTFTVTAYTTVAGGEVTTSASATVSTPAAPERTLILFR